MEVQSVQNIIKAKKWLTEHVIPLWFTRGFDQQAGCFIEALSPEAQPLVQLDRRAMVQARQIYSVSEAAQLGLVSYDHACDMVLKNIKFVIEKYKLPEGGYAHAVNSDFKISNYDIDLYTQAFILFALARVYGLSKNGVIKNEAIHLARYLKQQRALEKGGYSEIKAEKILFQSNPHMHLYEAVLEWAKVDSDPVWLSWVEELKNLCLKSFIDQKSQILAEHFISPWSPQREDDRFIFEPGHHYEWAWLHMQYQKLTGNNMFELSEKLFSTAEKQGLSADKKYAFDEIWSDFTPHKKSARFWPQCERIKAALVLAELTEDPIQKKKYTQSADQAFEGLFTYLNTSTQGLWYDSLSADGKFQNQPAKASSLYHIINAFSEYIALRPGL